MMLQNKRLNILMAFIAALSLWAYVTGSVDPNITKKFVSVPIKIINEDSLLQDGLAVEQAEPLTVDINVIGTRAQVNKMTNDDIIVTADLYGRNKGTNYVALDVNIPKGMKLDSKSQDRIIVKIDDLVSEEKYIEAAVNGVLPENTALSETKIEPEKMMVYGTKNNVKRVKYIEARLNAKDLSGDVSTQIAGVIPVDDNGKEIQFVSTEKSQVTISAKLAEYKQVQLKVKTVGEIDDKYEVDSIKIPETVEIMGDFETLDSLDVIYAEDVNISNVTKSTKIKIKPILPAGIKLKDEKKNLYISIVIKNHDKKIVEYLGSEVEIKNLSNGLKGVIDTSINVTISGKQENLDAFKKKDISLYVDAFQLVEGEYELEVYLINNNRNIAVSHTPIKVKVIISKE